MDPTNVGTLGSDEVFGRIHYEYKPTLYKNSIVISTAFGIMINVVSQQNKFQPYNKRPVGIKFIVLADKSTIRCIEAHII